MTLVPFTKMRHQFVKLSVQKQYTKESIEKISSYIGNMPTTEQREEEAKRIIELMNKMPEEEVLKNI